MSTHAICHASLIILLSATAFAAEPVDFNRDVRPILSDKCFKCHGPDPATREAEMRLDTQDGLFADRGGYAAFVPHDRKTSEALRRILSEDEFERMPPPDSGKSLSPRQIEIIASWVEQGARWEPHWAFVPPVKSVPPAVNNAAWPRNAIDQFVLSRLEAEGLSPAPAADRYTLVRRVYLDLVGLPPTPEQADAFVADDAPDAYERLVDRLLASPHYGERWARRWLDLARYADTNGYEKDRPRSIWPYRDWVVDALNTGMPFDEFTIKQLAGDMLPNATIADRIATGFHRNTMLNEEGGIDPLEFRYHAMTDRVATTGTTWLGLTTGCAQCHDHKYDPISHREYFGLMAFLNNANEPELPLPDPALDALYAANLEQAAKLLDKLPAQWPAGSDLEAAFSQWLKREREKTVAWTPIRPSDMSSNLPLLTLQDDASVFVTGDTTKQDSYRLTFRLSETEKQATAGDGRSGDGEIELVTSTPDPVTRSPNRRPVPITAFLLEALPDDRLPAGGPGMTYYEGRKGDFFLTEFRLTADGESVPVASATHSYANNQFGKNPATAGMAIDGDMQTGWSTNGRAGERHTAVFTLAEPVDPDELRIEMTFGRHFASSLGRFRISVTNDPAATARDRPVEIERLLARPDEDLTSAEHGRLRDEFLLQAPELAKQAKKIRALRKRPEPLTTLVFSERPAKNMRPTYIHNRGEYLQPTDEVTPLTIEALHPFPDELPRNRLGFARWLVLEENPLTARVVVNRQWAALFGRGIVSTVQDFGFQGEPPSHPDLLDWLAVEFMEGGWRPKDLHRLIVTSATYRQSSHVSTELLQRDPQNVLLARGPRLRLEAELIRDSALAASGLLSPKLGGEPVKPPQPAGVTEAAYGSPKWDASTGEDRYRRSLYTFIKRTAPFAMYSVFDAPSGEACTAKRDVSNTALQSLTLLNDVVFLEAAQALGGEIAAQAGDDTERARRAFRRVLTRQPTESELSRLVEFVKAQRTRFASDAKDAAAFAGEGTGNPIERASWTALARALLSLDEAITRS